jgi:hypothetical protein
LLVDHVFLFPMISSTMPPTSAMPPATGGKGKVFVLSAVISTGPTSATFSLGGIAYTLIGKDADTHND